MFFLHKFSITISNIEQISEYDPNPNASISSVFPPLISPTGWPRPMPLPSWKAALCFFHTICSAQPPVRSVNLWGLLFETCRKHGRPLLQWTEFGRPLPTWSATVNSVLSCSTFCLSVLSLIFWVVYCLMFFFAQCLLFAATGLEGNREPKNPISWNFENFDLYFVSVTSQNFIFASIPILPLVYTVLFACLCFNPITRHINKDNQYFSRISSFLFDLSRICNLQDFLSSQKLQTKKLRVYWYYTFLFWTESPRCSEQVDVK